MLRRSSAEGRSRAGWWQLIRRNALRDNAEGSGGGNTPEFATSIAAARGFPTSGEVL